MLFLRCMCTRQTLTQNAIYIIFNKGVHQKCEDFLFPFPSVSFSLSLSLSFLSFFARFTRFVSLDRSHIVSSNPKKKRERKKKKKINNSPKSTFFSPVNCMVDTGNQREKGREKRLKSLHNYACISYNQGQSSQRTHIHSYTTRMMMMMMMMIQFYIFNIDT